MATKKTYPTRIVREGSLCLIPVPFDPKPVFGKVRAPVKVTVNGYTYRTTISPMAGGCVPLRRSHREAAGLEGGESLKVTLELDEAKRTVTPPRELASELRRAGAWEKWKALSFTHQREHVEAISEAKKPETRARRIAAAVERVASRPEPKRTKR